MKLFISYSSKDREVVTSLADDLDLMDHSVWFDRELNRSGGHQWWKLICEQIRQCEGFIYALSPHVINSIPCQREYEYARVLGKPILPLILIDLNYRYLPLELQKAQIINFRTRTTEQRRGLRDSLRNLPACPPLPANALQLEPAAPLDPVGMVIDRIHNLTTDLDQQKLLIVDINNLADDEKYAAHVPELLQLLVARHDVLKVRNLRRAQELLKKGPTTPSAGMKTQPPRASTPTRSRSVDLLPAPFAWVEIPSKGYSIAKYPVTNAQFSLFIDAGGYREKRWWTNDGWETKAKGWNWNGKKWVETNNTWSEPRYWTDPTWNNAEQPVVGISWYESVAFCLWLSEVTGEKIMLPTEEQWQYAAQGDDSRSYPWGTQWDCEKCNNSVKPCESTGTSSVRQYEGKGDSPFGVVDMAGNVWEWCLTDYEDKTNSIDASTTSRVLRGGSWLDFTSGSFRCDYRYGSAPDDWGYYGGFRLALS